MKISQDMIGKMERHPVKNSTRSTHQFEQIVQSESQRLKHQGLEKLMSDIVDQGKKIAKFRSFQDLAKFKRMIRKFLQEAVYDGLELEEARSFNVDSFSHTLMTVKQIDEKLVQ